MVQSAIRRSLHALHRWDRVQARWVIDADVQIDQAQYQFEEQILNLLATQQPIVATDLRLLSALILIASELERMGDYAKHIAQRTQDVVDAPHRIAIPDQLWQLGDVAQQMLTTSVEAFAGLDTQVAQKLDAADPIADSLERSIRAQILEVMSIQSQLIRPGVALLDIAHALERVADRATNIGERVIYIKTAAIVDLND